MADHVRDYERRAIEEDFKSESMLRKREPRYNLVPEEFERFITETDRAIEELRIADPVRFEEIGEKIGRELKNFKSTRDRTKS
jgi:hypothetical protein